MLLAYFLIFISLSNSYNIIDLEPYRYSYYMNDLGKTEDSFVIYKFEPKSNVPLHIDKFKEFSCPILLLSSPNTLFNVLTPGNANIINDRHPENALSSIDDADNTCIDVKFEQFLNASALISLRYMLE